MPNPALKTIGDTIKNFRRSKGISQEKLAELTGLHRTYIGGVERGERNISLLNLIRLARALGVAPSDLVKGIE